MYQNEIREMDEAELMEVVESHKLTLDDENFIDADEVIELLEHEIGKIFESAEDDILDSIMNGNWAQAVEQMFQNHIHPHGLVDYINDYRFEQYDGAYEFFTLESAVSITELYNQMRKEVA
ncbi:hypothetical protein [Sulfurovum sp.]|uniref:hypothetical protein n=1 Tax=Sulfurovum sp. TaxID=1969726 RepID=UPI0035659AB0